MLNKRSYSMLKKIVKHKEPISPDSIKRLKLRDLGAAFTLDELFKDGFVEATVKNPSEKGAGTYAKITPKGEAAYVDYRNEISQKVFERIFAFASGVGIGMIAGAGTSVFVLWFNARFIL